MDKRISIAIDGPAAAGKSTVAKVVAKKLSYVYIDTGAMYRTITYAALERKVDIENEEKLMEVVRNVNIEFQQGENSQLVFLNGQDVSEVIRTPEVTNQVSIVAKHRLVREEMVRRQQELAKKGGVVMDGRDIGTHVMPDAEVKIFMLASVEERAERRHLENINKGFDSNLEQLKEEIAQRDKLDSEREVSPLKKADDALELDTTSLSIEEVVQKLWALFQECLRSKERGLSSFFFVYIEM
ncbi:(d)CMP kinase [Bacillus cereus]|nr:(d)CMP kinase [Bacillus cereus]